MHLEARQPALIDDYLRQRNQLTDAETLVSVEKPGEGNMNYTLRLHIAGPNQSQRTLIIKQSRGYVEKYPTIAAPANRADIEGRFYLQTQAVTAIANQMPRLLDANETDHILLLEDLGTASDYTFLYQPDRQLSDTDVHELTAWLSALHRHFTADVPNPTFANRAMRALNHEHIFNYPFLEDNGFDLDTIQPGLQQLAMPYKRDNGLKETVRALGERYLADGPTLLHGDFYPGSWLQTANGAKVIDPEFCFYGPAEFDLGVMIAHLMMAEQPTILINAVLTTYERPAGFDNRLRQQFTGVEIIRRLIGLAQLPLNLSLETKRTLLNEAHSLLN